MTPPNFFDLTVSAERAGSRHYKDLFVPLLSVGVYVL
jgi:hypothetical protein